MVNKSLSILFLLGMPIFSAPFEQQTGAGQYPAAQMPHGAVLPMQTMLIYVPGDAFYQQLPGGAPFQGYTSALTETQTQMRTAAPEFVPGAAQHGVLNEAGEPEQDAFEAEASEQEQPEWAYEEAEEESYMSEDPYYTEDEGIEAQKEHDSQAHSLDLVRAIKIINPSGDMVLLDQNDRFSLNGFVFKLDSESEMRIATGKRKQIVLRSIDGPYLGPLMKDKAWATIFPCEADSGKTFITELQVAFSKNLECIDENNQLIIKLEEKLDELNSLFRRYSADLNTEAYFDLIVELLHADLPFKFQDREITNELLEKVETLRRITGTSRDLATEDYPRDNFRIEKLDDNLRILDDLIDKLRENDAL